MKAQVSVFYFFHAMKLFILTGTFVAKDKEMTLTRRKRLIPCFGQNGHSFSQLQDGEEILHLNPVPSP